jgi:ribonuclease inhibitor
MQEILIDTQNASSLEDVHSILAKNLNFPDHYGNNLDALFDCISELDVPLKIVWKNYSKTKNKLGKKLEQIYNVLLEYSVEEPDFQIKLIE